MTDGHPPIEASPRVATTPASAPRKGRSNMGLAILVVLLVLGFGAYVAYQNKTELLAWFSSDVDVVDPPSTPIAGGVTTDDLARLREDVSADNAEALKPFNERLTALEKTNASLTDSAKELANIVKDLKTNMATKEDVAAVDNRVDSMDAGIEEFKNEYDAKHEEMAARIAAIEEAAVVDEVVVEEEPPLDPSTVWLDRIVAACPTVAADVTVSWVRARSEEELQRFLDECDSAPALPVVPVAALPRESRPRVYTEPALTTSVPKEGGRVEHPYINRPAQYRCWIDRNGGRHRVANGSWRATGWCYGPSVN